MDEWTRGQAKFQGERELMDAWARWLADENNPGIGYPKASAIASQMERGENSGLVEYVTVSPNEGPKVIQLVDRWMFEMRTARPKVRLCLEARHRHVIGTLRIGMKCGLDGQRSRFYNEREVAEMCFGGDPQAALRRFRAQCSLGYEVLREHLLREGAREAAA